MTLLLDLPGLREREAAEPGFSAALASVASRLDLNPSYIGAVMSLESGFKPEIVNASGGATGLIQFMPKTAEGLGTSTTALRAMTGVQQLKFVEAYFARVAKSIRAEVPGDYYMATFLPSFIGKPSTTVLAVKGEPIYDQNAGLDSNKDGTLTVSDVTARIDALVKAANARPMFSASDVPPPEAPTSMSMVDAAIALAGVLAMKWLAENFGDMKK